MRNTTVKQTLATRFQSNRGKFEPIAPKPLLFSFLLKKQDKHTQVPRFWRNSRGKKKRGFYGSYHPYLMKAITMNMQELSKH